jgi:REP element-mobilizing transposase RayT
MVAERHGWLLLTARVHDGDYVTLFGSAAPKVCMSEMVRVFNRVRARMLFDEFSEIKEALGGHFRSEGYAIRTAGVVTSAKIEKYSTDLNVDARHGSGE